ncbi:peptidase dimerization domain-containing protein, partial [Streptomyces sp. L7]
VNALVEAAHQVLAIAELGRPEAGTTVTPTVASAGTLDNVVPAAATVVVDVRVESAERRRSGSSPRSRRWSRRLDEAVITVRGKVGRPPMPESAAADCSRWRGGCCPGLEGRAVGGGSDGNSSRPRLGCRTLDGLGRWGGAHADHEYSGRRVDGRAGTARRRAGGRDPQRRIPSMSGPLGRGINRPPKSHT